MRCFLRRTGLCSSLLAIFVASGGHWMALQTVAWTRMLYANSIRGDALVVAVSKAFDGEHACSMCHQIQAAREAEKKPSSAIASAAASPRLWMAVAAVPAAAGAERRDAVLEPPLPSLATLVAAPPDPPPRGALAPFAPFAA